MSHQIDNETTGAWIVHHGRKIALHSHGAAEYPALDEAAKAAALLSKLAHSQRAILPDTEVYALAQASGINPRHELKALLNLLEDRRLIQRSADSVSVIGLTGRAVLSHAAAMYRDADPTPYEDASITLAELASLSPVPRRHASRIIGEQHELTRKKAVGFLDGAEQIGFVDVAGAGSDRLLFNGNLFRRASAQKTHRILESLTQSEQQRVLAVQQLLTESGCLQVREVVRRLDVPLFKKLAAAGLYDISAVSNERGKHSFLTVPSAFHKFVDPMVDDCFDLAKALVASLTYGMHSRHPLDGRIQNLPALLRVLISGREVGPTTSIGEDYRALEVEGVVKTRKDTSHPDRYHLRLLKIEVGQLALQVLTDGAVDPSVSMAFASAPVSGYIGPEQNRVFVRKRQDGLSQRATLEVLDAVRRQPTFP